MQSTKVCHNSKSSTGRPLAMHKEGTNYYVWSKRSRRFTSAGAGYIEDEDWRIRKDGTRFWANVVITALFDKERNLLGFGKITRDLTERKKMERFECHGAARGEQA